MRQTLLGRATHLLPLRQLVLEGCCCVLQVAAQLLVILHT